MKKADFIACVAAKLESSETEAARNLEAVLDAMQDVFRQREILVLPGFAILGVKARAARSGRNPATGAVIQIPAATVPYVRISAKMKTVIAEKPSAKSKKKTS